MNWKQNITTPYIQLNISCQVIPYNAIKTGHIAFVEKHIHVPADTKARLYLPETTLRRLDYIYQKPRYEG